MGKVTGFMEYDRLEEGYAPVQSRVKSYKEFVIGLKPDESRLQAARLELVRRSCRLMSRCSRSTS